MKKIITIDIIGTILPIILFLIEKNIPYKLLEKITILSKDIYYSNYYGILETVIIIIISLIILKLFYNKKSYLFHVYLNSKSIILITLYSI